MSNHQLVAGLAWAGWLGSGLHFNWGEGLLEEEVMRCVVPRRGGGLQMMPLSRVLGRAERGDGGR